MNIADAMLHVVYYIQSYACIATYVHPIVPIGGRVCVCVCVCVTGGRVSEVHLDLAYERMKICSLYHRVMLANIVKGTSTPFHALT